MSLAELAGTVQVRTTDLARVLTADEAALLAFVEANPSPRPEPERDSYGRYKLAWNGASRKGRTRATTLASTIADQWNLTEWKKRNVGIGMAMRPDLGDQVLAIDPEHEDAKSDLRRIVDEASEAAGANIASALGTAMHTLTEHHDLGTGVVAPEPWRADVEVYDRTLGQHGIVRRPEWVERVVYAPTLDTAGTLDRIVVVPDGTLRIGDVKTGRDLGYSWLEISIQLGIYANAEAMLADDGKWEPMPPVDRDVALVFHMPIGAAECTVYEVDIASGWRMAQTCTQVRKWRKSARGLARPMVTPAFTITADDAERIKAAWTAAIDAPADPPAAPERTAWVLGRIEAVKAHSGDAAALLGRLWAEQLAEVPTPKAVRSGATWSDLQTSQIIAALAFVEAEHAIPFGPSDPTAAPLPDPTAVRPGPAPLPPAPGDDGDPVDELAVRRLLDELPGDLVPVVRRWMDDGRCQARPWTHKTMRARHLAALDAAVRCALHLHDPDEYGDDFVRAAVGDVLATPLEATWLTGALFGCLTIDQAVRLAELAASVATPDTKETSNP